MNGTWDGSSWDEAVWDSDLTNVAEQSYWMAIGKSGYSAAPEVQLTFNVDPEPNVELISTDFTYTVGSMVN